MAKIGMLEKSLNDKGMYELKINGHLLFRAADNETIKYLGEAIASMSTASDFSTMIIG